MNCHKTYWTSDWIVTFVKPIIFPKVDMRKRKFQFFLLVFQILWYHLAIVNDTVLHLQQLPECSFNFCKITSAVLVFWNFCLVSMWYSLILRRKLLRTLFEESRIFHAHFRDRNFQKVRGIMNTVTCVFIFICFASWVTVMTVFITDKNATSIWYRNVSSFKVSFQTDFQENFHRFYLFIYFTNFRDIYVYFPGMVTLFHISFLFLLILSINLCERKLNVCKSAKCVDTFMNMYSHVHSLATALDAATSPEIFFMACYQFSFMYIRISDLYIKLSDLDIVLTTVRMLQNVLPFLFLLMSLAAAEVHSRDMALRKKVKDISFQMSLRPTTSTSADILLRFMDSKPAITFTAWMMFSFKRTLILTSAGVLVTYSILILQFGDQKN